MATITINSLFLVSSSPTTSYFIQPQLRVFQQQPRTHLSFLLSNSIKSRPFILASSTSSSPSPFDDFSSFSNTPRCPNSSRKSVLTKLIQEIEPLDVSVIQKDVAITTVDAMKRTISSMLGLLPSDQFQVSIEALWEPLSKLLISSIMTGYILRNAEYRLCLENNFDAREENSERQVSVNSTDGLKGFFLDTANVPASPEEDDISSEIDKVEEESSKDIDIQGLGEMSPEAQQYILQLQSRLSSVKKELREVKRKSAALQMQRFVGEEKNDLLDYLRSLQPEKVAELSEPACEELKETIHSVVHGLLATLSPSMHSKAPSPSESASAGMNVGGEDCAELVENTSIHFQPLITLSRDYLARLLFWCMLLGHYLRGLEYRMELMELLSLTKDSEDGTSGGELIT